MQSADDGRRVTYPIIAARLGGTLVRRWRLTGGVSADVQALALRMADGAEARVVVRRHGANDWKPVEADVAAIEYAVMRALADAGLPVPRPLALDRSGEVLPTPYLVLPFVDADATPTNLDVALEAMATFLAQLHAVDVDALELAFPLPHRPDDVETLTAHLPPDLARDLAGPLGVPPMDGSAVVLHGDFWPGNILWRGDAIAAVIDWEDAALGDPLCDLAGSRVELLWKYDRDVMASFTAHYVRARGPVSLARLALWELYVCSAGLAYMHEWGLAPAVESEMRRKGRWFLERAAAQLR